MQTENWHCHRIYFTSLAEFCTEQKGPKPHTTLKTSVLLASWQPIQGTSVPELLKPLSPDVIPAL